MNAPDSKIAVTLFNLRDYCKNESDLDCTLAKVRAMGYRCVQVSAVPLEAEVIRKLLDRNDLYCCATHENLATLTGDINKLVNRLQTLNCDFTALGSPENVDFTKEEDLDRLAEIFRRVGDQLGEKDIMLGYHNHSVEFTRVKGQKKNFLELFMDRTAGHNVWSELDIHWVTRGGGSPAAWIAKFAGRISVIHFKDFALIDNQPVFCEIGEGNLDWAEILKTCEATGVRWYSIEQDREYPGRNIFDSIKISYDNLTAMGVR